MGVDGQTSGWADDRGHPGCRPAQDASPYGCRGEGVSQPGGAPGALSRGCWGGPSPGPDPSGAALVPEPGMEAGVRALLPVVPPPALGEPRGPGSRPRAQSPTLLPGLKQTQASGLSALFLYTPSPQSSPRAGGTQVPGLLPPCSHPPGAAPLPERESAPAAALPTPLPSQGERLGVGPGSGCLTALTARPPLAWGCTPGVQVPGGPHPGQPRRPDSLGQGHRLDALAGQMDRTPPPQLLPEMLAAGGGGGVGGSP